MITATVNALQQKLNTENDASGGKLDAVSGQVQSLNDSVDELKARIAKLDKNVQDLQAQLQNMHRLRRCKAQPGDNATGRGTPRRARLRREKTEDPRDYRVDFSKIHSTLGFEITKRVPDGIRELSVLLRQGLISDPDAAKFKNV